MARYTDDTLPEGQELRLSLDRYQEIMRINIAPYAFNGINNPNEENCYPCAAIWKQYDRDAMAEAIAQAEEMREAELNYNLAPVYSYYYEEMDYSFPVILAKKHLIEIGTPTVDDIQLAVPLTLSVLGVPNDPIVITVPTTVTDPDEICVYYPGEDVHIHPSKVVIAGGNATITIPRYRLLDPSVDTNCEPFPLWDDDSKFLTTVDVKRCYNDPQAAYFVWFGDCNTLCMQSFNETTQDAYPRILNKRLSIIELYPAVFSGGSYTSTKFSKCCHPCRIRVNYKSGRQRSMSTELLTARLAHTLLSEFVPYAADPCSQCYRDDRMPDPSKLITPYGTASGAIKAWMADSRAKVGAGGVFSMK